MNKYQAAGREEDGKTCESAGFSYVQAGADAQASATQCRFATKSRAPWQPPPRAPPRSRPDEDLEIQTADD